MVDVSHKHSGTMRSTKSGDSLAQVQRWLRNCIEGHVNCSGTSTPEPWSPSRLIRIESMISTGVYQLRLISTHNEPVDGAYVTLSHRWSTEPFLRLDDSSVEYLSTGFKSSTLPQAFNDSVYITSALSFRYIWIDSLCIKQDSHNDWIKEATQMHQIYSRSVFNISAIAAKDCKESMFALRDDSKALANRITDKRGVLMGIMDMTFWGDHVHSQALSSRGWVLQERMLSPRTAYFCKDQIFWECRDAKACESWPLDVPVEHADGNRMENLKKTLAGKPGDSRFSSPRWALHDWYQIAGAYSSTKLTKWSDRLVAFSGIAVAFAAHHGLSADDYAAGFWKSGLQNALFWHCAWKPHNPRLYKRSSPEYVAPSFSWLSVEPNYVWIVRQEEGHVDFTIRSIHLEYSGIDKFGSLKGGHLLIQGMVRTIQWSENRTALLSQVAEDVIAIVNGEKALPGTLLLDHDTVTPGRTYYCIAQSSLSPPSRDHTVRLLLLEEVRQGTHGSFRRIGIMLFGKLSTEDAEPSNLPRLKHPSIIPALKYSPDDGTHLIKII